MNRRVRNVDGTLYQWDEIADSAPWSGLLIGNGASRALWDRFGYSSLFEVAESPAIRHPLSEADREFFRAAGDTGNFEAVLGALSTARVVCDILGQDTTAITERYGSIRNALVDAVHAVHVPWEDIPDSTLLSIRKALLDFDFVYSTNYDLLVYWAMMAEEGDGFRDYFWGRKFNVSDTKIWKKCTKVLYLHGALHLYRSIDGGTIKDRGDGHENLLDRFGTLDNAIPLFVSEGGARSKLRSILSSDYLSFAFQQFGQHKGPLVIFGHGLSNVDQHIIDVVAHWGDRTLAYGMLNSDEAQLVQQKARIIGLFPEASIHFFDAESHPLGNPEFQIVADG